MIDVTAGYIDKYLKSKLYPLMLKSTLNHVLQMCILISIKKIACVCVFQSVCQNFGYNDNEWPRCKLESRRLEGVLGVSGRCLEGLSVFMSTQI